MILRRLPAIEECAYDCFLGLGVTARELREFCCEANHGRRLDAERVRLTYLGGAGMTEPQLLHVLSFSSPEKV